MRTAILLLALLLSAALSGAQAARPRSPGIRQAEQAETQAEKNIPPPQSQLPRVDIPKLQRDASELAALSQSIPPDIERIAQGTLPKDYIAKLKEIEKLSKRLRTAITR